MEALKKVIEKERYTYEDYITWPDEPRCELVDGKIYLMTAPKIKHQRILKKITVKIEGFLENKSCELFVSPIDVRLNHDEGDDTVVQPDLLVVCDENKIDEKGIIGVPDLIIEIISPSSVQIDTMLKFNKYLKAGVKEYWIVDPENKLVIVNTLDKDNYISKTYEENDIIHSKVLVGLEIKLSEVFV